MKLSKREGEKVLVHMHAMHMSKITHHWETLLGEAARIHCNKGAHPVKLMYGGLVSVLRAVRQGIR